MLDIAHYIYTVLDIAHHSEIVLSSPGDGLQYNLLSRKGEEEKRKRANLGPVFVDNTHTDRPPKPIRTSFWG